MLKEAQFFNLILKLKGTDCGKATLFSNPQPVSVTDSGKSDSRMAWVSCALLFWSSISPTADSCVYYCYFQSVVLYV